MWAFLRPSAGGLSWQFRWPFVFRSNELLAESRMLDAGVQKADNADLMTRSTGSFRRKSKRRNMKKKRRSGWISAASPLLSESRIPSGRSIRIRGRGLILAPDTTRPQIKKAKFIQNIIFAFPLFSYRNALEIDDTWTVRSDHKGLARCVPYSHNRKSRLSSLRLFWFASWIVMFSIYCHWLVFAVVLDGLSLRSKSIRSVKSRWLRWRESLKGREATTCYSRAVCWLVGCRADVAVDSSLTTRPSMRLGWVLRFD